MMVMLHLLFLLVIAHLLSWQDLWLCRGALSELKWVLSNHFLFLIGEDRVVDDWDGELTSRLIGTVALVKTWHIHPHCMGNLILLDIIELVHPSVSWMLSASFHLSSHVSFLEVVLLGVTVVEGGLLLAVASVLLLTMVLILPLLLLSLLSLWSVAHDWLKRNDAVFVFTLVCLEDILLLSWLLLLLRQRCRWLMVVRGGVG